jgi:cobalt-zinc-cadmium efflux system outer membrane protein
MNRKFAAATLVVAGAWARVAIAEDASKPFQTIDRGSAAECARPPDANAIVRCALAASPEVREARAQLDAAGGRRASAGVWLPSNPTVSALVSRRRRPAPDPASVLNWSVVLSQELEIAGQRGARVDAVDAEVTGRARRVGVAEQEVAAGALMAYYEAIAAQETVRFAAELAQTAQTLAAFAEGRAKEAMLAGVEADVARAEATRIGLVRFEAERRLAESRAGLAVLLDVDARELALPGVLVVPPVQVQAGGPLEDQALRLRGEVAAAEMERQVLERRLALVRRERVPNLTLSAFAERGEIDDRILGVGLSIPLPLPAPVGRTRAGEIAETMAQIRAAESSEELVRRRVRLEVARAQATLKARQGAADLFAGDLLKRARTDLSSLRDAISSRQLSLREALQWQRTFIELLQADIEVRLGSVQAWVDLRRVVGLPFVASQGGAR